MEAASDMLTMVTVLKPEKIKIVTISSCYNITVNLYILLSECWKQFRSS